jgi:hypothetical protein
MDFLDPVKKKRHARRLFIGYFCIGLAIILASLILMYQARGYDVDRKTGKIIQNGLIYVNAQPEAAKIYLNGKDQGSTDKRLTVPEGKYTLELKRDGYYDWKRTFWLAGSSIEQMVYPKLFPKELKTFPLHTYNQPATFATASPDRHWLVVGNSVDLQQIDVFDTTKPTQKAITITLPAGVMTATKEPQTVAVVEWSTDNRHILLKHTFGAKTEFIVVDREDVAASFNITGTFGVEPTKVTLHDKKVDQLYLYDQATKLLSLASVKAKTMTTVLDDVVAYKAYKADIILYVTPNSQEPTKVTAKLKVGSKTYIINNFPASDSYLLEMADFDGHQYVVVNPIQKGRVYVYRDVSKGKASTSPLYASMVIDQSNQLLFSANTRFIMAQGGNRFAVYDLDTKRTYTYKTDFAVPETTKASWMDGHRILVNADNKLHVFDFDGINQHVLVDLVPGTDGYFDRDFERLFDLQPSTTTPGQTVLTYSLLKISLKE